MAHIISNPQTAVAACGYDKKPLKSYTDSEFDDLYECAMESALIANAAIANVQVADDLVCTNAEVFTPLMPQADGQQGGKR